MNAAQRSTISARQLAVGLTGYCAFINLYAPQSILPLLSHEFGASAAEVSTIITVSTLAVALTAPFTGAVADVLGRKRVIVAAMFVLVVPTVMVGTGDQPVGAHLLARGAGAGAAADLRGHRRLYRRRMAARSEATTAAGIYIVGLEPRRLQRTAGDRIVRRPDRLARRLHGARRRSPLPARSRSYFCCRMSGNSCARKDCWRPGGRCSRISATANCSRPTRSASACCSISSARSLSSAFISPPPPYNLSATWLGAIFVVYLVGSVLSPLVGWAVARFGRRRFTVGCWRCGLPALRLTLAPSLPLIILGLAISAGCGLICQAISTGYVTITAKAGRSSAVGLYVTSFYVGGSFGAALGGLAWTLARLAGLRRAGGGDAGGHGGRSCTSPGPAACRPGRPRRRSSRRERVIRTWVPKRPVAGGEHGEDRRRRQHIDVDAARARPRVGIARRRPAQQPLAAHGEGRRRQARSSRRRAASSILRRCMRLALPSSRSACSTSSIACAVRALALAARTARRKLPRPCAGIRSRADGRRRAPSPRRGRTIRCSCRPTPRAGGC